MALSVILCRLRASFRIILPQGLPATTRQFEISGFDIPVGYFFLFTKKDIERILNKEPENGCEQYQLRRQYHSLCIHHLALGN